MPLSTEAWLWGNATFKSDKVQQLSRGQSPEDCVDSDRTKAAVKMEQESPSAASDHGTPVSTNIITDWVSGNLCLASFVWHDAFKFYIKAHAHALFLLIEPYPLM